MQFGIIFSIPRSAASDFIETLSNKFSSIQSLNTMLQFSKSLLLLLMDDEHEIRERNARVVTKLLSKDEIVIPSYAQELYIEFLIAQLRNFHKHEAMALILLIAIDGSSGDNSLDENIAEYQVFDKNEVNIFSETFIVRQICLTTLKQAILKLDATLIDETISNIIEATKQFEDPGSEAVIKNFLHHLMEN